jgi:rubrerythrin
MDTLNQIEQLHNALDAENIIPDCFKHLSALIKNGRIRNSFISFSEAAKNNQRLLKDRLSNLGAKDFVSQDKCTFCKIKTESFSLSGALNLGLEANSAAIKFYKNLLTVTKSEEDKKLFNSLIKEKNQQQDFLKKEKKFLRKEEDKLSLIDSYCITEVIAKLWRL